MANTKWPTNIEIVNVEKGEHIMADTKVYGKRYNWPELEIVDIPDDEKPEYRARWIFYMSDPNRLKVKMRLRSMEVGEMIKLRPMPSERIAESVRGFCYRLGEQHGIRFTARKYPIDETNFEVVVERLPDKEK